MTRALDRLRQDAIAIYDAGVAGVEPRRALTRALAATPPPARVHLVAIGKAAFPMAAAAVQHLERLDVAVAGGVVVSPDPGRPPHGSLVRIAGDHPLPGDGSSRAADAVGDALSRVDPKEELWLLLSGGATSLAGAPVAGLTDREYRQLIAALGRAGLPIRDLNRVRKRFSRWGAGRMATATRAGRIRVFALSDVPGDDPADIGSGPCEPDPTTAAEILALLATLPNRTDVSLVAIRWLERAARGDLPETPKPDDPRFAAVITRIVASNDLAREAAAARALALGYDVRPIGGLVTGAATTAAARLVEETAGPLQAPTAWIAGGETTVALGAGHGRGGRCQELALAGARILAERGTGPAVLLAGGTDGRDGPTDAAGAVVDDTTWAVLRSRGIDPERALRDHDAYPALAAAGALLRSGLTGTNVMDLMIVVREPAPAGRATAAASPEESGSRTPPPR